MSTTAHRTPGELYAGYTQLEVTTCPTCGVMFACPEHMLDQKREHAGTIYCPNGHTATWKQSEADRLRAQLRREQAALEAARHERNNAQGQVTVERRKATRARNERDKTARRVAAGVCPCCGRTFKQLARHMSAKHPDYGPGEA